MPRESSPTSRHQSRDRDRHREKDRERDRDRHREKDRERDRDRDRDRDRERNRDRDHERHHDRHRDRKRDNDRDRDDHRRRRSDSRSVEESRRKKRSTSRRESRSTSRRKSRSPSREKTRKRRPSEEKREKSKSKDGKRSRRSESSSSSSSAASASSTSSAPSSEIELELKLVEKRAEAAERRKLQKQRRKMMETPEEKRARRLMKKELKERRRKAQMGWDSEYLHYTNADNPFGDSNLLDTFLWKKKLEKEGLADLPLEELEVRKRQKMEENKKELEKVKERRVAMEKEREDREQDIWAMQRLKEADQFKEWHRQEELFHLDQAKLRSKIRIQDGRAKPIDLLAKYISAQEDVDAVEMHEPYTYLTGLGIEDLEDLLEDIKVYQELEREVNQDFWDDMTIIVNDELIKLRRAKAIADAEAHGATHAERIERPGVHASVAKDVADVFRGKTPEQLDQLKESIATKVADKKTGPPGGRADLPYWESLLQQLHAYMARARLREAHQANLRKKLEMLKAQQGVEEAEKAAAAAAGDHSGSDEEYDGEEGLDSTVIEASLKDYDDGRYSPEPVDASDFEPGTIFVSEDDDAKRLEYSRQMVLNKGRKIENVMTAEEKALQREARKGMTDDEASFAVEADLEQQSYLWSDKYRPRKPRYFNRVHTGFEWNKYNQTHYDMDNPPPKIVQGYKFNIFYPDLLDKSTTPSYTITPCGDQGDFAILRFKAGPPYEDIAFKIVNREWEYSYRRGFRCQFHNSIFQLWFHFKRYRYRR